MNPAALYSVSAEQANITFNHGDQLNIFSEELVNSVHTAMDQAERDQPRYVVFRAEGRAFSAGLDLGGLDTQSDGDLLLRLVKIEQLLQRVRHAPFATVALVHGNCYGAAADLVLACRNRIATEDARFLMPGIRFGIILGNRRLRDTLGENQAYALLDRIKPFNAQQGLTSGFLTAIAARDKWEPALQSAIQPVLQIPAKAYERRVDSLTPDTRSEDLAALVESVSSGSIRQRMIDYVAAVKAAKQQGSG